MSILFDAACLLQSPNIQHRASAGASRALPLASDGTHRGWSQRASASLGSPEHHCCPGLSAAATCGRELRLLRVQTKSRRSLAARQSIPCAHMLGKAAQGGHGAGQCPRGVTAPGMFANTIQRKLDAYLSLSKGDEIGCECSQDQIGKLEAEKIAIQANRIYTLKSSYVDAL